MKKLALLFSIIVLASGICFAQTSGFTYQGKLGDGGAPANGDYQFECKLFDALTGGNQIGSTIRVSPVRVTNGGFTTQLDFGAAAFVGHGSQDRWLDVSVRLVGGSTYTVLTPRQQVNSVPFAVRSATADSAASLAGVAAGNYVQTSDARLSDARAPTTGSANYIQNTTAPQAGTNFNIGGDGTAGGTLTGNVVNATKVGIGTTNPLFKLHVKTGADQNLVVRPGVDFSPDLSGIALQSINDDNTVYKPLNLEGSPVTLNVASAGYLGIGTTTPTEKLHVAGGNIRWGNSLLTSDGGIELGGTNTIPGQVNGHPHIDFHSNASAEDYTVRIENDLFKTLTVRFDNNNSKGSFDVQGTISADKASAGNTPACWNAHSDLALCSSSLRYKTDIKPFSNGLSFINLLRPIAFSWKDGGMKDVGFGAEDVEKISPLLVTYNSTGQVEGVKYDRFSVLFVNAIKEQQAQIAEQHKLIEKQQEQIDLLKQALCHASPDEAVCKR